MLTHQESISRAFERSSHCFQYDTIFKENRLVGLSQLDSLGYPPISARSKIGDNDLLGPCINRSLQEVGIIRLAVAEATAYVDHI